MMENKKQKTISEKQIYIDYPCYVCGRLRMCISTIGGGVREYVCTDCRCGVLKGKMAEWQIVKKKLEDRRGIRFVIGMRLVYPFKEVMK